jgi:RNA polymerase sigma factor (sigma-70 family)
VNTVVEILDSIAGGAAWGDRTDGQLLDLFVGRRDQDAFAAVVRRHGPMVRGVCRRVLRNPADADDAFQAAFLVLARKAGTIRRELLAAWLYGVAFNTARKLRRTNARRAARECPLAEQVEPHAAADPNRELLAILDEELSRLPERYRSVIVLCDLEGRTRREAAKALNCPEGTVGGRLARARALLAARLTARGAAPAAGLLAAVLADSAAQAVPPAAVAAVVRAVGVDDLAGAAAKGLISPNVAHTTEKVLKSMFATKLRTLAASLLCCGFALACAVGAIHLANARPASGEPAPRFGGGGAARPAPADAGPKKLSLIPLKTLDAKPTAEKLAKLLPAAVTVAAVRDENALVVYATAKGTDDVRLVLRALGEELPKDEPARPAEPKRYATFRFRDADWDEVLKWYAEESGLTLVAAVKPKGKVTIGSTREGGYTFADITDLINEALAPQKFILVRRKLTFFIHPTDEKIEPSGYQGVELSDLKNWGKTELVEVAIPLQGLNAPEAKPEVEKLLTPFGSVAGLRGKVIVVRDTVGNIERILKTLAAIENPPKVGPVEPAPARPKTYSMRFEKAAWKDVLAWYAAETGLTRVGDAGPTGTFTLVPPTGKEYTLAEITDLINDALLAEKWLLVRGEKTFTLLPADDKVDPKWAPRVKVEELHLCGRTELVEVVVTPTGVVAADIIDDVRKLLGPFGQVSGLGNNVLVIRDTARNVRRIVRTFGEQGGANNPKK